MIPTKFLYKLLSKCKLNSGREEKTVKRWKECLLEEDNKKYFVVKVTVNRDVYELFNNDPKKLETLLENTFHWVNKLFKKQLNMKVRYKYELEAEITEAEINEKINLDLDVLYNEELYEEEKDTEPEQLSLFFHDVR